MISFTTVNLNSINYIMITLLTLLLWSWKMIWSLRPCDAVGRISSIIQESSECDIDSDCQNADFDHEHHVYVSSWLFKCAEWKGRKRHNEIQWVKRCLKSCLVVDASKLLVLDSCYLFPSRGTKWNVPGEFSLEPTSLLASQDGAASPWSAWQGP